MKTMDTNDEWIQQRTGIVERHYVDPGMSTAELGANAARAALSKAKMDIKDIDFIIFASLSPDYCFPGCGVFVQDMLGAGTIGAMDVRNQCSGFLYSLSVADQFIKTGMYNNILVIGAEVHSTGLDFTTRGRDVTVLFGDGGGAVILGPSPDESKGILSTHLHSQGQFAKALWCENPGSLSVPRVSHEMIENATIYPKMNGKLVFKHAIDRLTEVINEVLTANNKKVEDVSLMIPHQANLRINQFVASSFGIPEEKVFHNIQKYGNTTAGSIPIALDEALEQGKIKEGDLVLIAGFGSGFTWGSALVQW